MPYRALNLVVLSQQRRVRGLGRRLGLLGLLLLLRLLLRSGLGGRVGGRIDARLERGLVPIKCKL